MSFSRSRRFSAQRTADSAGAMHASQGQAHWFDALRQAERAGAIRALELEPSFRIEIEGAFVCNVKADARFFDVRAGRVRVLDYKGVEGDTPISKLKRRLVRAAHKVEIEIEGPARKRAERKAARRALEKALTKMERV